jgi:hypothetical protein
MMNQQSRHNPTIFELLGRGWQRPAAIANVRFNADDTAVAFASADGTIALAPVAEPEPPESRIRISSDLGQMRILPRSKPPLPLIATPAQGEGSLPLVPYQKSDFLYGSTTGSVTPLTPQGEAGEVLFTLQGPVLALDHSRSGAVTAASAGDRLYLARRPGEVQSYASEGGSPIKAIAFSPGGGQVAGLLPDGLAIWSLEREAVSLQVIALPSSPISLGWSGIGDRIACGLEAGGFSLVELASGRTSTILDFPAPVRTVAWSEAAQALVASGAFRIAAWSMQPAQADTPHTSGALVTGHAGLVLVDTVAAHPTKDLVAAGYASGRIVVARLGMRDELTVRLAGGSVTALAWSSDGHHLAIGDIDGNASIVTFPPQIFK